ncbi:pilus assembly protein N-terminal domain-containing protein [Henriciella sp.]|uniref:pilus assembly protein N-terminal domain-containing protein n=1 Tax=Henriciella sp. TaxID=1968823 RepID=UPI0026332367|nr:pilus assembly protein N-terminal domain-containing protein [Henriciella sp.]
MKFHATILAASLLTAAPAVAQQYSVESGMTRPVKLSKPAASVIIGNQNIADVAVADPQLVLLTGKSFGTTNLLVLDKDNNIIVSAEVMVTADTANMVTVSRGGSQYTYDCASDCRDAPVIGDDQQHFSKALNQAEQTKALTEGR